MCLEGRVGGEAEKRGEAELLGQEDKESRLDGDEKEGKLDEREGVSQGL